MYILGISCYYHDSSAALLKDGVIVAAAQEERFTRIKHDATFPKNSIDYCLMSQGITINQVDYIGYYEKPLLKFERILSQHLEMFPLSWKSFLSSIPSWINQKLQVTKEVRKKTGYEKAVLFIDHHMSHAASSFLDSPFKKAAIVTCDGVGEWTTTSFGIGAGNNIKLFKELNFPHSVGLLYSTITAYLGFSVNNSEYKVMGMAAYGDMKRKTNLYYKKLLETIDIKNDGSFHLDMSYFNYHFSNRMPSRKICNLLGGGIRRPEEDITKRHFDIAAAIQTLTEEILMRIFNYVYEQTKMENLVVAGGVALNSVINGKILKNTKFKNVWIHPDPGDGGTSVGVALYIYNTILGKKRVYQLRNPYLGPSFKTSEIKNFLKNHKINFEEFSSNKELIARTSKLIFNNNVIGWFQMGMEWGPRALGARSILSNPCNPDMQNILNTKVKHREKFRPFAPVVCEEDAGIYFETDKPIPDPTDFMLMVYPIKNKWRCKLPAVTHADGSGRLQTIRREQNPLYYQLIKEFGKLSGIPVLINTSFNIRGEPIICTPDDAYKCMMGTGIDYLVIDRYLIKRTDNPKDIWDSESTAKD